MKQLLCLAGLFLCLCTQVDAQNNGDHNDAAPLQTGYAVITPTAPVSGLTVMETFGVISGSETLQSSFHSPDLVTSANMFVDVNESLGRNLGVALANPNAGSASVTLTVRGSTGTVLGSRTITVDSRRQTAQFVTSLVPISSSGGTFGGPPTALVEYTGTLSIVSNTPISIIGFRFRGAIFSTVVPTTVGATFSMPVISQGVGGSSAILLPHFATGAGWETQIVISNSNSSNVTIRLDLFKQDGSALTATLNGTTASSFTNLTVPGSGVLVLSPRDSNGDDRF